MNAKKQYENENALMFAQLEELAGKVESRIAKVKSYEQQIVGLKFELEKARTERDEFKGKIALLKRHKSEEVKKEEGLEFLEGQSFSIRNKIAKIVADIDGEEASEEGIKELIQTLIGEIDECIRLLR
ncbi:MAG: chromosome segregation ATPase [Arcticibacterium sp.]|jgi:chromosome segregation ATPase